MSQRGNAQSQPSLVEKVVGRGGSGGAWGEAKKSRRGTIKFLKTSYFGRKKYVHRIHIYLFIFFCEQILFTFNVHKYVVQNNSAQQRQTKTTLANVII